MASFETQEAGADHTRITIEGRLDVEGVEEIETRLVFATTPGRQSVLLDMSKVTFLGSLGVGMLVRIAKALMPHHARVVVFCPSEAVERVLTMSGTPSFMPIVHDEGAAREALLG